MLLVAIWLLAAGAIRVSELVQSRFAVDGRAHRRADEETLEHGILCGQEETQDGAGPEDSGGHQDRASGLAHAQGPGLQPELGPVS